MSKKTIYAEDAIGAIRHTLSSYIPYLYGNFERIPLECEAAIRRLKPVEPQRIKARWDDSGACTHCGYLRQWDEDLFCANCGAWMTEEPEPEHTMEEFMYGQDLGSPEDGSL